MALSSKGCIATISEIQKVIAGKGIVAVICTYKACREEHKKTKYQADFKARVLLFDKEIQLNRGDIINIKSFYIKNCCDNLITNKPSYVITEWDIRRRNKYNPRYYKQKGEEELRQAKLRQRKAIEEELAEYEQELDDYIENNGEDDTPF